MAQVIQSHVPLPDSAATPGIRRGMLFAGAATILAGAMQGDGGLLTQAHRGASAVADDRLTFPWDGASAVTTTLVWGLTQVLFVAALVVFARSGATGTGRAGRVGAWLAVGGGGLFVAGHGLTLAFLDASTDDAGAIAVYVAFAVGSLFSLVGFLMAGAATLRAGRWTSWRRYTPVAIAVAMIAVLPLQFTALLPLSVALFSATIVAFGVALLAEGGEPR
jgi:hypothetical protein